MSFPLWKLFLVVATYAAFSAAFAAMGWFGFLLALILGTSGSGIILLTRKENVASVCLTALGGVLGAVLGFVFLTPFILGSFFLYDHGYGETARSAFAGSTIGAIAGSVCGAAYVRWRNNGRCDPS